MFQLKVVQQSPYDVLEIAAPFAQVIVVKTIISLQKIVADLLNRPLRIDVLRFNFVDDAIDEQPVLQHKEVGIDQK